MVLLYAVRLLSFLDFVSFVFQATFCPIVSGIFFLKSTLVIIKLILFARNWNINAAFFFGIVGLILSKIDSIVCKFIFVKVNV